MADLRISDLPALAQADAEATDDIPLNDVSAAETKRITAKALVQRGVSNLIDDGAIPGAKIADEGITQTQIADDAVGADQLAASAVVTASIVDANVTEAKIADAAVTTAKIADDAVTSDKLAAGSADTTALAATSVTTAKIADDAVTNAKIATDAVNADSIEAAAVGTAELADGSVTTAKLAADAVTNTKLADNAVETANITNANVTTAKIADLGVTTAKVNDAAVTEAKIASNAVTTAKVADSSITYAKTNFADGAIPGAKLTADSVTATQIAPSAVGTSELVNDSVTNAKIGASAVGTTEIADNAITTAKLAADSVQTADIQNSAVTTAKIADNAVNTSKINDGSVTNGKLADLSVSNAKIVGGTIGYEKTNFADGSVPGAKISDGSVTAAKLATDSVTQDKIADRAVGAVNIELNSITNTEIAANAIESTELAANAVTTAKIADNNVTTAKINNAAVTDAKIASGIDGAKLSNDTVTAAKVPSASLDRGLDKTTGSIGHTNAVTAGTTSGITFDAQGHITDTTALVASDLPEATATEIGGVSVPSDSGLSVNASGEISITNSVTAATVNGITFDADGLITNAVALSNSDLPLSTSTTVGGVIVSTTSGLEVDGAGNIIIPDSGVASGTHTKVTVNDQGIVTGGADLADTDIPDHSAAKLTSGTIPSARIGTDAITGTQLADSSTAKFGGADDSGGIVVFPAADYKGQFFFDSRNEDLYIYDGNAYQPVTITSGEIIFGGTYDASDNTIASVTTAGQAAGFTAGSALPAASADNLKYYLVVSVAGTGTAPAPAVSLNPPDILLSNGTTYDLLEVSTFVASQQASNISYTPQGTIASTNVQTAITELDTEKLPKAGGTITGTLEIGNAGSLVFEGATTDDNETTIAITDPTADRTITFPDTTGTVVTTGDSGTVTSTMLADDSIVNADINSSAAIAYSKLAALTDAHILVGNSSNVATVTPITGDIGISNTGVVSITAGSIVNADINASAAIAASKIVSGSTSGAGVLQLSDSTTSTSTSLAATANAVKVTKDVADAALPVAGGTLTGEVVIGNTATFKFEGATADNFETTLAVVDPTADRTVTFQDASGTVAFTSQLDDGTY